MARRQLGFVQQELVSFRGATNELRDAFRAQLSRCASGDILERPSLSSCNACLQRRL